MSRKNRLGPPPSRRQPAKWEELIRETVFAMSTTLVENHNITDGATIRRRVLEAARRALGDASTMELVGAMIDATGHPDDPGPKNLDGVAGLMRVFLDQFHPGWSDSITVESVMLVVQRAADEWFRHKLAFFARSVAAMEYNRTRDHSPAGIEATLARVMDAARHGLEPTPVSELRITGAGGATMATPSGLFRSAFTGLAADNPAVSRSLLDSVERSARRQLAERDPGRVHAA